MNNRLLYLILIFIAFSCDDVTTNTEIEPSEELVIADSLDPIKDTLIDIQPTIIDTTPSINEITNSKHTLKIDWNYEDKYGTTEEVYIEFTIDKKYFLEKWRFELDEELSLNYRDIMVEVEDQTIKFILAKKTDSSVLMSISFNSFELQWDDNGELIKHINKKDYINFIENRFGGWGMDEWTEGPFNLKEFRNNTLIAYIYNAIYYCDGCDQPVVYDKWKPRGKLIDTLGPYLELIYILDNPVDPDMFIESANVIILKNISDLYNNLSYLSNIKFIFKNNTIYFDPEYGFSDSFIPTKPAISNTGFKEYLKTNYVLTKHNIIDSAYGEYICTEELLFSNGIKYHYKCGLEGKNSRNTISFPKTELEPLKKLIETLYDEPDNFWETPFYYVPEDMGCWYFIDNEVKDSTIVSITCGC